MFHCLTVESDGCYPSEVLTKNLVNVSHLMFQDTQVLVWCCLVLALSKFRVTKLKEMVRKRAASSRLSRRSFLCCVNRHSWRLSGSTLPECKPNSTEEHQSMRTRCMRNPPHPTSSHLILLHPTPRAVTSVTFLTCLWIHLENQIVYLFLCSLHVKLCIQFANPNLKPNKLSSASQAPASYSIFSTLPWSVKFKYFPLVYCV